MEKQDENLEKQDKTEQIAKDFEKRISGECEDENEEPNSEDCNTGGLFFSNLSNVHPGVCSESQLIDKEVKHHAHDKEAIHV